MKTNLDDFMIGLMLGDGHLRAITNSNQNSRLVISCQIKNKDIIDLIGRVLKSNGFTFNTRKSSRFDKRTKKTYESITLESHVSTYFTKLRNMWYNNEGKKIIPDEIKLSPLALSVWFMGDGHSRWIKGNKKVQVKFCTDCFTEKEVKILLEKITELGIQGHIFKVKENRFNIGIMKSHEVEKLMIIMKPYITNSFNYKIKQPIALSQSEAAIQRIKRFGHTWSGRYHTKESKIKIGITSKLRIQQMSRDKKGRLLCQK